MGKGSAPRPMPNRAKFENNFDAIFNKEENNMLEVSSEKKPKSEIMRRMRERRKSEGLTELTVWVTAQQKLAIEAILQA
tara:strand:- start:996 stop:1232 length:237 start_codon:yes stop_codon:yes gene_type:complete